MKRSTIFLGALAGIAPFLAAAGCRRAAPGGSTAAEIRASGYHCPMHPDYHSDHPGNCPICGMTLVADGPPASAAASPAVPGRAAVTLDPARRQALGVATVAAESRPFTRTLRAAGRVAIDETRIAHVHVKTTGYIEHLFADYTGKTVRRGEPLMTIYSPELYATEQEYVAAFRAQQTLAKGGDAAVNEGGRALLAAARQRLLLWDVPAAEIRRLEAGGAPGRTLTLSSPESGVVTIKNLYHGMQVSPEMDLLQISDLTRVWIEADLYEDDLAYIRPGMRARVSLDFLPGDPRTGTVEFIAPQVDPATRTVRIRVALPNADLKLRPEMLARVELTTDLGARLSIPEDALVMTGERTIVFREDAEGALVPLAIVTGARGDGRVEVKSGLAAGDQVVVRANFLVDSESRLRAALASSGPAGPASAPARQEAVHDPSSH